MIRTILLAVCCVALTRCVNAGREAAPLTLEPQRIAALEDSVFEVVIRKRPEPHIRYVGRAKLPVEELPFAERNDDYFGIGTAFALSGGRLVSAAHVFQLDQLAIDRDYFVRDRRGKVYAVDKVTRFSQYRDLVEFSLRQRPPRMRPLEPATRTVLGETVYTIGNANGEGIAVRVGQIASYTFEPIKGAWKDLRFSAPASPGNSGGPLVNTRGEVVGVVVRKNESENLNVAVPIAELSKTSSRHAEFFVPSIEANGDFERVADWSYRTKLPATMPALARRAEGDRRRFHLRQWKQAVGTTHELSFPTDPALQPFYASQKFSANMQILSFDDKQGFDLRPEEPEWDAVTARGETVFAMVSEDGFSLAQIDLPEEARHADYVKRPERILEALLEAYAFFRDFNGRRIPLASYGPPEERGVFVDPLGRPWLRAIWRTHYNQASFILNCLPSVTGFGCALDNIDTADETLGLQEKFEAYYAAKITMSYWGSVGAWRRFLALGDRLLPAVLKGVRIEQGRSGRVHFVGGDFQLAYPQPLYSDKSWIFVGVGYGLRNPLRPEIRNVRFDHGPDFDVSESFEAIVEPKGQSLGNDGKGYWADLMSGRGIFDGRSRVEGREDYVMARRVLGRTALTNGRRIIRTVSCKGPPKTPFTAAIENTCATIEKALRSLGTSPGAVAPGGMVVGH
jgi:hypothetical protein